MASLICAPVFTRMSTRIERSGGANYFEQAELISLRQKVGPDAGGVVERCPGYSGLNIVTMLNSSKRTRRRVIRGRGSSVIVQLLVSAIPAHAATNDMEVGSPAAYNPAQSESVITEGFDSSKLRLGKGDWVISGPLVDGLHRRHPTGDRHIRQRILDLPIIQLLVPKPMPSPPGGGRYFLWGESSRPWASISSGPRRAGSHDNPLYLEGGCNLISVNRSIREPQTPDAFQPSETAPPAMDALMMLNDATLSLPPRPNPPTPQEKGPDRKSPPRKQRPKSSWARTD